MWRNRAGHESCDYVDEGPGTYVYRCRDGSLPQTMDGRRPIDARPRAWVVPVRPVRCVDDDEDRYYCPHCDWCDYYCLCAALKDVGTDRDADGTRYGRMVERRRRETRVFRVGDRESVSVAPEEEEAATKRRRGCDDDVGTKTAAGDARPTGRVAAIARQGSAVAVDEGGELSTGQAVVGALPADEASERGAADGSDAGGSGAGVSGDAVLTSRIPSYGRALTEEELTDWTTAKESGDVKVCCSWTAAADCVDDPKEATPRCCVWVRRPKRPRSPTLRARVDAAFDDDWEHECDANCSEATGCHHAIREAWVAREALRLAGRTEALRKQWRQEIAPGVLYSTRRYEETMRLAFDRCGRLLRQPADLDWIRRAQAAIDIEAIDEDIVEAERELEERRRLVREREEAIRAWDADPVELAVAKETPQRRRRRIAQTIERLGEDETLHDEPVLVKRTSQRPKKKPKRFNF